MIKYDKGNIELLQKKIDLKLKIIKISYFKINNQLTLKNVFI